MSDFDLCIRGGLVVDGSGAPGRAADLGIRDGRIAEIGSLRGSARQTLDASGCVVAPGFVDLHTHYDAQVLWDRMLSISPWHGVTSVLTGNCGFGVAPTRPEDRERILGTLEKVEGMSLAALQAGLGGDWGFESFPEYLDCLESSGIAINVAVMVGHTPLRLYVMGEEATEREARPDEVEQMRALLEEGLAAGGLGFATSRAPTHMGFEGRPVPSRAASMGELETLAEALGTVGHGVLQTAVGADLPVETLAALQRRCGRPVTWTALLSGFSPEEELRASLERHADLQAEGVALYPQVACRPLNLEFRWDSPFPFESHPDFAEVAGAKPAELRQIYTNETFRNAFRKNWREGVVTRHADEMVVSYCPEHPDFEERRIADLADEQGLHFTELALDLGLESDFAARFRLPVANSDEKQVAILLQHPSTVLGLSDAGAHASQLCDAGAPTHLLGYWVREKGVLSLEEGVRQLTSSTADCIGLTDRGRLQEGLAADIVVFDPETVGCGPLRRVHDLPAGADRLVTDATGIHSVIVNGTPIREHDRDVVDPGGALPGRLLRGGAAASRA